MSSPGGSNIENTVLTRSSCSEAHLRQLFARYGIVQTCIVNNDKRHAFVKMINREDAVKAREGMEQYKQGDMQLRVSCVVSFFADPLSN